MASTHAVFKELIPTEIPIQPPVLDVSKIDKPDPDSINKLIEAFNELHKGALESIELILNLLYRDVKPYILPIVLIKIIIDYCSFQDFARRYEPYRCKGVKDIKPDEYLFLSKNTGDTYPLIIPYHIQGELKATITADFREEKDNYAVVNYQQFQNITAKYIESDITHYRGIRYFPKNTLGWNKHSRALYSEGGCVIDSTSPIMIDDFKALGLDYNYNPSWFNDPFFNLVVLEIPQGFLADVSIKGLSYTLAPPSFCPHRAFEGNQLMLRKIYNPQPSRIWSFFCCKRKKVEDIAESKDEAQNKKRKIA